MAEDKNVNPDISEEEDEGDIIELTDQNGEVVRYELLDVVPYKEEEYIVVIPADDEEAEEVEIYQIVPDESDETETYVGIDDDELLEDVFEEFKNRNADLYDFEE